MSAWGRASGIGFLRGLRYPFWGLRFVYGEERGLARYWIWPIFLTATMAAFVLAMVVSRHEALLELLWPAPTGDGRLGWFLSAAHAAVEVLFALVLAALGLVASVLLGGLVAAPFNDALSEEIERLLTGREGPPFSMSALLSDLGRALRLESVKLLGYALVMLPLFVASFLVPVVGHAAYVAFGFTFTALYFALDYVDWPASRRGKGVRERLAFARKHFGAMLGFGIGVWAFLWVPVLNLFFMPAAVAGGTKLFLDLEAEADAGPGSSDSAHPRPRPAL